MIERLEARLVHAGPRLMVAQELVSLECGCCMVVGWFVDWNPGAGVLSAACGEDHLQLVEVATGRMRMSLESPSGEPLAEVCERMLEDAAIEVGA